MPLQNIYIPQTLDEFRGNKALVKSLKSVLERQEDVPQVYLFTGPSGCGKSSLAKIVKNVLNVDDGDYHFYDTSNTRGIETIRTIVENAPYFGLFGGKKLYVFEECFPKGTMISTMDGFVPIENLKIGDKILNIQGEDVIEKVFINKIPLSRIVQLKLSNGKNIICSEDHEFLTRYGWMKAKFLDMDSFLCYDCNPIAKEVYFARSPKKLQSRYWKRRSESCNRGRWEHPLWERGFLSRQKKRKKTERVGVESVTFFKSICDVKSFGGVIGHRERSQGFAEFYDLKIKKHPSYIANNCLVHNCHGITGPAQEAMLDMLENPPQHSYFVLCTTEPEKLKTTLKRRCFKGVVKPLSKSEIKQLLTDTAVNEEITVSDKIIDKITDNCDGSPGIALGMLDDVIDMDDENLAMESITQGVDDVQVIELCRALVRSKADWSKVKVILNGIDMNTYDPERVRRIMRNYFNSVMLANPSDKIADRALLFTGDFVDSKGLGLTLACWEACKI